MSSTLNAQTSLETHAPVQAESGRCDEKGPESRLEKARLRLRAALAALDAAVSRQTDLALEQTDQRIEYSALQEDRSRLAMELDAAVQRTRALEAANAEATRRIERAASAVRAVLATDCAEEE